MSKRGKKYNKAAGGVDKEVALSVGDALQKVKDLSFAKFDESVDVAINLGIDATKGEQTVRSSVVLPHGRGKKVRVIVFAKGEHADAAQKAGADEVGFEDLIEKVGHVVPALPVSLVATVFADGKQSQSIDELELKAKVSSLIAELENSGVHVHIPREDLDYAIGTGIRQLLLRHIIIKQSDGRYQANDKEKILLQYYANSIAHLR